MTEYQDIHRLGRVVLTALCIGTGAAALSAVPFAAGALAKNSDHGGQGGDHGGGHGDHGGSGAGNGNSGGNSGGNASGHSADQGEKNGQQKNGSSDDAGPGSTADTDDGDPSLSAHGLGKLNGFFHASDSALEHASPNSPLGKISQTFAGALSAFAAANASGNSGDGTAGESSPTPPAPTVEDLGAILAGATNKPVTAAQVQAIADRLAEMHPEDAGLADFAANEDEAQAQGIADAANAAQAGMDTTDDDASATTSASE